MLGFTHVGNENIRLNKSWREYSSSALKSRFHNSNFENLKNLIDYFSYLRNIGKLTDEEFSAYLTWFVAAFAEKEITEIVNETLVKSFWRIIEEIGNE
jgi:hypothetical protein